MPKVPNKNNIVFPETTPPSVADKRLMERTVNAAKEMLGDSESTKRQ